MGGRGWGVKLSWCMYRTPLSCLSWSPHLLPNNVGVEDGHGVGSGLSEAVLTTSRYVHSLFPSLLVARCPCSILGLLSCCFYSYHRVLSLYLSTAMCHHQRDQVFGWTALHKAAACGEVEVVAQLLDMGSTLEAKDEVLMSCCLL